MTKFTSVGKRVHAIPRLATLNYPIGVTAVAFCGTIFKYQGVEISDDDPFCRECRLIEIRICALTAEDYLEEAKRLRQEYDESENESESE